MNINTILEDTVHSVYEGKRIWKEVERKYSLTSADRLFLFETDESDVIDEVNKCLCEIKFNYYVMTYFRDLKIDADRIIYLQRNEYEAFRLFYLTTLFRPGIKVISGREPFGNLDMLRSGLVDTCDYVKKGIIKI